MRGAIITLTPDPSPTCGRGERGEGGRGERGEGVERPGVRLRGFVLLAGLLASTACSVDEKPPTAGTAADSADQIIFGLTHNLTQDGVPKAMLQADTAYFYQQSQIADLRHIHVTFYAADGSVASRLTAMLGKYEWRTGNMHAMDQVVAVTPDGRRLTTSMLDYKPGSNQISGPEAFVFEAPGRHLEGDAFTSDPDFKNVVATHPRKGTLGKVELGH